MLTAACASASEESSSAADTRQALASSLARLRALRRREAAGAVVEPGALRYEMRQLGLLTGAGRRTPAAEAAVNSGATTSRDAESKSAAAVHGAPQLLSSQPQQAAGACAAFLTGAAAAAAVLPCGPLLGAAVGAALVAAGLSRWVQAGPDSCVFAEKPRAGAPAHLHAPASASASASAATAAAAAAEDQQHRSLDMTHGAGPQLEPGCMSLRLQAVACLRSLARSLQARLEAALAASAAGSAERAAAEAAVLACQDIFIALADALAVADCANSRSKHPGTPAIGAAAATAVAPRCGPKEADRAGSAEADAATTAAAAMPTASHPPTVPPLDCGCCGGGRR